MTIEMRLAEDNAAQEEIFRHRYDVYCEELKRYRTEADHEQRLLREDIDAASRHLGAYDGGEPIGSMRWIWGGDAPFIDRHIEHYCLAPFLETIPSNQMIIGERFIVSPAYRGSDVLASMFERFVEFVNERRIQLIFGDCEPHHLNLYTGLGFRTFSKHNINSAEAGYLIPLVLVVEDLDYLLSVGSPLVAVLREFGDKAQVPATALEIIAPESAVRSQRLSSPEAYWQEIETAYALSGAQGLHLMEGLSEAEIQIVLEKSNVIECRAKDRVLKKRDVAENMYVVLSGTLEAWDRDQYLATLMTGDIIGEIAFLLHTPRTADVVAMTDGTRLLALSQATIQNLIESHPALAAKFLLNIARLLCAKLAFRAG